MQTADGRPPRKNKKLPSGFLSTSMHQVKKNYFRRPRYIVFLPRSIWPLSSGYHHQAFLLEYKYFENPLCYSALPTNPTLALTPLPLANSAGPRLIHYHPSTPYLLHVARGASLGPHDVLYFLERAFGHCLIDRTGILNRRAPTKILRPLVRFDPNFTATIAEVCDVRAQQIMRRAENERRSIAVLWSGGIDSTTAIVALLRVMPEDRWKSIHVLYTDKSKEEYELFYSWLSSNTTMIYLGETIQELYKQNIPTLQQPLIVTGELGDQIFGSMLCEFFFEGSEAGGALRDRQNDQWKDFFATFLRLYDVVPEDAIPIMSSYIEAQVEQSPVPVINAFDLLWWFNFSLKWQHVSLRIPLLSESIGPTESEKRLQSTIHFFDTAQFEQWSYHNHHLKMSDRNNWATYKAPLKDYIFLFNKDKVYRDTKLKERSLKLVKKSTETDKGTPPNVIGIDENLHHIHFGISSISLTAIVEKYGNAKHQLPPTDLSNTVLASGNQWAAPSFEMTNYIRVMNRNYEKEILKIRLPLIRKIVKQVPPCKVQEDWRFWFVTHRAQSKEHCGLDDQCKARTLISGSSTE